MTNSYDSQPAPRDLDQLQPPMRGSNRDSNRLACADHLRHSMECAQHEINYWQGVLHNLTLAVEELERR